MDSAIYLSKNCETWKVFHLILRIFFDWKLLFMGKISFFCFFFFFFRLHHIFMIPTLLKIDQLIPLNYTKTFSLIAETFSFMALITLWTEFHGTIFLYASGISVKEVICGVIGELTLSTSYSLQLNLILVFTGIGFAMRLKFISLEWV